MSFPDPPAQLLILTDARGFTTCVEEVGRIMHEAGRVPLLAPIHVTCWQRIGLGYPEFGQTGGWVRREDYDWPGTVPL